MTAGAGKPRASRKSMKIYCGADLCCCSGTRNPHVLLVYAPVSRPLAPRISASSRRFSTDIRALTPDRRFRKTDLGELGGAQMRFVRAEEFVELRRRDRGSGEHRMHLAAMMDLVLEQVREQPRRILGQDAGAALHGNRHDELRFAKRRASIDQPAIRLPLRLLQLRTELEGFLRREESRRLGIGRLAAEGALEHVDVIPIDGE